MSSLPVAGRMLALHDVARATNKEKQMIKIFNRRERRECREDILFIVGTKDI